MDGATPIEQRAVVVAHLAGCARCRAAVAATSRALRDPGLQRDIAALSPRRRFASAVVAAVLAASLLFWVWPSGTGDPSIVHRASPITAAPAPAALWPAGIVQGVGELRWSAVEGASRYRVTLFDSAGTVRFEVTVTDTVLALPASAAPTPGRRYWWSVNAAIGIDRWVSSALTEFTVQSERR